MAPTCTGHATHGHPQEFTHHPAQQNREAGENSSGLHDGVFGETGLLKGRDNEQRPRGDPVTATADTGSNPRMLL